MSEQMVYLMLNGRNGLIKIGIAKDPKFRERTLQSEEPDVFVIATAPGGKSLERDLHTRYSLERVRGEWFRLSALQVKQILSDGFRPSPGKEPFFDAYRQGATLESLMKEQLICEALERIQRAAHYQDIDDMHSSSDALDSAMGSGRG